MKTDIYAEITQTIVAALESGNIGPWSKTWTMGPGADEALRICGTPYQGINQLFLSLVQSVKGYDSPYWLTFKAGTQLDAHVRKGEKAVHAVYFSAVETKESRADKTRDEGERDYFRLAKAYAVFNACQFEGLPSRFFPAKTVMPPQTWQSLDHCEQYFAALNVPIVERENQPAYSPGTHQIFMPPKPRWSSAGDYYATLAHEATHATGHKSILDREHSRSNRRDYAYEELIAELGAAFLCRKLKLSGDQPRTDHISYLASWLKALQNDKKYVFDAAAAAQKAITWMDAQQKNATAQIETAAEIAA
jgi:antirestriction protein ArdC